MRRPLALLLFLGCNGGGSEPSVTPTPIDPATTGTIAGKVLFQGTAPKPGVLKMASECAALHPEPAMNDEVLVKDGRLRNVFVYVKEGLEKYTFARPATPATMSNRKCVYVPRVVGARVNQPIEFANEDPTDHNIHGFTSSGEFNFMVAGGGARRERKISSREVMVRVKCDIHPWMIGYVGVLPHPFFRVTGADGAFELKGVPAGTYVVEAWHEKYGTRTASVKLDAKGTVEVDFTYP